MKKLYPLSFLLLLPVAFLYTQDAAVPYAEEIAQHRKEYKEDFLKNERAPLNEEDLEHLRFFEADEEYRVKCTFELTPDEQPFDLPTYSGITKPFRKYGILSFELQGQPQTLAVYQSLKTIRMPMYRDHLFLPFKDLSNGETTYGGGRYLNLVIADIQADEIFLDFNKCYNPWCHYSDGYNCPIPPTENHLEVSVNAGERNFVGEKKHK